MAGRRIDDHSFWAGGKSRDSVLPEGVHVKHMESDGHSGEVKMYEDTSEAIKMQQSNGEKKVRSHEMKPTFRY